MGRRATTRGRSVMLGRRMERRTTTMSTGGGGNDEREEGDNDGRRATTQSSHDHGEYPSPIAIAPLPLLHWPLLCLASVCAVLRHSVAALVVLTASMLPFCLCSFPCQGG